MTVTNLAKSFIALSVVAFYSKPTFADIPLKLIIEIAKVLLNRYILQLKLKV